MLGKVGFLRPNGVQRVFHASRLERQPSRCERVQTHPGAPRVDAPCIIPALWVVPVGAFDLQVLRACYTTSFEIAATAPTK